MGSTRYIHTSVLPRVPSFVQSCCPYCMKSLGASPNPAFIRIVEKAHQCDEQPERKGRLFIVQKRETPRTKF
jgi:hypothetical protein